MTPGTVKVYFGDNSWVMYENVTGCWVTTNSPCILVISINNEDHTVCYPINNVEHWEVGRLPESGVDNDILPL